MSVPTLVHDFYERIWNVADQSAIASLLAEDFAFRGSLGAEMRGRAAFWNYVCAVRSALAQYRCEILDCVCEGPHAFAKMCFSGVHVGELRGHRPSGLPVRWLGAALFRFDQGRIAELWVLGDLAGLDAMLSANLAQRSMLEK
jgi:predicted ester cyclase